MRTIAVLSDTHAVADPEVSALALEHGATLFLHAGDVGNHGGEEEVLAALRRSGVEVAAVRGNVDDGPEVALPGHLVLNLEGWKVLMTHIVGKDPPPEAAVLIAREQPDIVLFGHSHRFSFKERAGRWWLNPGSAGPARFSHPRTMAIMKLPPKGSGPPQVEQLVLAPKAPPRGGGSNNKRSTASAKQKRRE